MRLELTAITICPCNCHSGVAFCDSNYKRPYHLTILHVSNLRQILSENTLFNNSVRKSNYFHIGDTLTRQQSCQFICLVISKAVFIYRNPYQGNSRLLSLPIQLFLTLSYQQGCERERFDGTEVLPDCREKFLYQHKYFCHLVTAMLDKYSNIFRQNHITF